MKWPKKACSFCGAKPGKPCVSRSSGVARGEPHKQRTVVWTAPREPDKRAELRSRADRAWPHPKGTPVTYYPVRRLGALVGSPVHTQTRTGSFYSTAGDVVVFIEDKAGLEIALRRYPGGYVLVSHLVVRELPPCEPHWSDT